VTWITGVPTVLRELLKATQLPQAIRIVSFAENSSIARLWSVFEVAAQG